MSGDRNPSDRSGVPLIEFIVVIAVLWWLRWIILALLAGTAVALALRWFLRSRAQLRRTELARLDAVRRRAELQNEQALRGDPAGFFGEHPLPDSELIPAWYTGV